MKKFKDRRTQGLFEAEKVKSVPPDVMQRAHNKLRIVARITSLMDLQMFPGTRLEALKGYRKGRYSIRVNDQWRICFAWTGREAVEIEFIDYH